MIDPYLLLLLILSFFFPFFFSSRSTNQDAHLSTKFVEVIGKVQEDLSLRVLAGMDMGEDLGEYSSLSLSLGANGDGRLMTGSTDMDVVNAVVKLGQSQREDPNS